MRRLRFPGGVKKMNLKLSWWYLLLAFLWRTDGAKLFAPLQAMPFIDGTELDYVREGLNEIFKFHNPKAQHECGCGESFGVQAE